MKVATPDTAQIAATTQRVAMLFVAEDHRLYLRLHICTRTALRHGPDSNGDLHVFQTLRPVAVFYSLLSYSRPHGAHAAERWFEEFKKTATPQQLYTFLYALPKGGDLHNHLQGAVLSEWMWDAALAAKAHGYTYYTKVSIQNCVDYGTNEFGPGKYLLLFRTLPARTTASSMPARSPNTSVWRISTRARRRPG